MRQVHRLTAAPVSRKTAGVIVGESPGSKLAKAQKAGVPVLGEAELEALIRG